MPLTQKTRGELVTRIATAGVIVALSWFAAVKEHNRPRSAGRGSYVFGLRTDLSCLPLPESAGARNILGARCDGDGHRSGTGNRRWSDRQVMFATLDAGRVCTRGGDIAPDLDSCAAPEETAVEWMRETFAEAEVQGTAAIMFIFLDGWSESHTELWFSLREELASFGKPVVDIYRTSPSHWVEEPVHTARLVTLGNLTSVATGDVAMHEDGSVPWMRIDVDAGSAEVFSFVPRTTERE